MIQVWLKEDKGMRIRQIHNYFKMMKRGERL